MTPEEWLHHNFSEVVDPGDLRLDRAKKIARLTSSQQYGGAILVESRIGADDREAIVLDVEVSLGQVRPVNDINTREKIVAICDGDKFPAVISLRQDFPDLPHLNAGLKGTPRSFCLYDDPPQELLRSWTALSFLNRVRWWLVSNAYGELHGDDQPLDPILFGGIMFTLIVPDRLVAGGFEGEVCVVGIEPGDDNLGILELREVKDGEAAEGLKSSAIVLTTRARPHGRLRYAPTDLLQLQEFDEEFGVDIVKALATKLREWVSRKHELLNLPLLILLVIPLEREAGAGAEAVSKRAFMTARTAGGVGRALGLMDISPDKKRWAPIVGNKGNKSLDQIPLLMGDVRSSFSATVASAASGLDLETPIITQIGVGALGSQLAMTLAREGYGKWTFVDDDRLMPHNLARHALPFYHVGRGKSLSLALYLSRTLNDPDFAAAILCNVLYPGSEGEKLASAIREAQIILDTSASVSVSRWLALNLERKGPIISIFFNPRGTDLVLLWEGTKRLARLDDLEIAYYSSLVQDKKLVDHLASPPQGINYGTSCREPSVQMPQSRVIRLVGVAAEQMRRVVGQEEPEIAIWRDETSSLVQIHLSRPSINCQDVTLQGWNIRCPTHVLEKLHLDRKNSGDIETGGVLIGAWDRDKSLIYIAGYLGPPPDSVQTKSGFIRGSVRLDQAVSAINELTMDNLGYVGEWHSHPKQHKSHLSADDRNFMRKMKEHTLLEDSPALMMVAGEDGVRCAVMNPENEKEETALFEVK